MVKHMCHILVVIYPSCPVYFNVTCIMMLKEARVDTRIIQAVVFKALAILLDTNIMKHSSNGMFWSSCNFCHKWILTSSGLQMVFTKQKVHYMKRYKDLGIVWWYIVYQAT